MAVCTGGLQRKTPSLKFCKDTETCTKMTKNDNRLRIVKLRILLLTLLLPQVFDNGVERQISRTSLKSFRSIFDVLKCTLLLHMGVNFKLQ